MHNFLTPLKRRPPSPHHHQPTSFKCHKSSRSFWWCCAHRFFGCGSSSGEGVKWPCSRHKPFSRLHCLWGRSTTTYEGLKKVYLLKISKEETESPLFKPPPASSNHHKVIKPDWPLSLEPFSKPLQICIGMHLPPFEMMHHRRPIFTPAALTDPRSHKKRPVEIWRESNAHPHPTFIMGWQSYQPYGCHRCSSSSLKLELRRATGQKYAQQGPAGHQCAWSTSEKFYLLIYDALWLFMRRELERVDGRTRESEKWAKARRWWYCR